MPQRTGTYVLTISAPGGSGPFTLYAVDLRRVSGALLETVELDQAEGLQAEFTFAAVAGLQYVIYIEPVGANAPFTDPVVEFLNVAASTLSRIDTGYQGEAEVVLFSPVVDGTVAIRVSDFFGGAGRYGVTLATLP